MSEIPAPSGHVVNALEPDEREEFEAHLACARPAAGRLWSSERRPPSCRCWRVLRTRGLAQIDLSAIAEVRPLPPGLQPRPHPRAGGSVSSGRGRTSGR